MALLKRRVWNAGKDNERTLKHEGFIVEREDGDTLVHGLLDRKPSEIWRPMRCTPERLSAYA